ncbi:MAG: excinuclease ABC subunit UvrC [Saprospiraceae bacterium]|nr:excinuclease ABC subunit UvrC [Saprospiraceae bacterium]
MTIDDYKVLLPDLPKDPGVYKYIDNNDVIIYVGKAKNLKNRISSYFGDKKHQSNKTRIMVKQAKRLEFVIVETETDALLLENTLIKKLQPRYNVMLKDGKSYSYICIKKERFPRVFITRKVIRDGSFYFGPYTSKSRIKVLLDLIKHLFPLRTCTYNLGEEYINAGKYKLCLEYHIKNCLGPCTGLEEEEPYNLKIDQIKNILKGNFAHVKRHFVDQMKLYAEQLEFEKAQSIKEKLVAFEDYQGKSMVVSQTIQDVDVFSVSSIEGTAFVNYIKIVNGAIINTYTQEVVKQLEETDEDILTFAVPEIRNKFNSLSKEILVPFSILLPEEDVKVIVPKIGDKKKLVELSEKNVKYFILKLQKEQANRVKKLTHTERILTTLKNDLQMDAIPLHIECFDNSNFQGSYPVSSCVVFKNAKPSKKDYRHFNIKTVEGPDDFASMEEVVFRRYKRLRDEGEALPQLVIIDGGKGQLSSSMKAVEELGLVGQMTVIGIAKRLEEIFFPGDSIPLYINKKSESLKLIQHARNEAHRFAITFHRDKRSKGLTQTELTNIAGVGTNTADKLLNHFGSVKQVKLALVSELTEVVGPSIAKKVKAYFKAQED